MAEFIGETNTFEAIVAETGGDDILRLTTEAGNVTAQEKGFEKGEFVHISIRPDKLNWSREPQLGFELAGTVTDHIFVGSFVRSILLRQNGNEVKIN